MDDLELERLMAEARPGARDDGFVLAVLTRMQPRGSGRIAGLLEGAVVVSSLALAWRCLDSISLSTPGHLEAVQTAGAAAMSAVLLWLAVIRRGSAA